MQMLLLLPVVLQVVELAHGFAPRVDVGVRTIQNRHRQSSFTVKKYDLIHDSHVLNANVETTLPTSSMSLQNPSLLEETPTLVLPMDPNATPRETTLRLPPLTPPQATWQTTKRWLQKGRSLWNTVTAQARSLWKRPAVQFRVALMGALTVGYVTTWFRLPQLWNLVQTWIAHRGFQGMAAFGRSFAYVWAALVAYPRLLDRRANDVRKRREEAVLQRRRERLNKLANQVVRLRNERLKLDAEIRSFRREIIALKIHTTVAIDDQESNNSAIQAAIDSEMAHLSQLRSETQTALTASRQAWAEYRSRMPPEVWGEEDDDDILVHSIQ